MSLDPRRDGDTLVVQNETTLPGRCPFCNAAATHPTTLHFRKRYQGRSCVTVHFFLCDEHAARHASLKRFCLVLVASGLVGLVLSAAARLNVYVWLAFFLLADLGFVLLFGAWSGHLQFYLRGRARDGRVWISGLCPAFLGEFSDSSS